jgi:glycosyltransferase involved in cell wall biosynthesis
MRLVLISAPFPKCPSEITYSFVFDEAYRLSSRGIEIHAVRAAVEGTTKISDNLWSYGLSKKIDFKAPTFLIKHLKCVPPLGLLTHISLYFVSNYGLNASWIAKKYNVDIIHAHFAYPEGLVGLLTKRETSKPLVISLHGYDILTDPTVNYGARLSRRYDAIISKVLNEADAVVCASNATYDAAYKIVSDEEKLHLIPNGVDVLRFKPDVSVSKIKKKLGLEDKYIVFTLRHHEAKYGVEYLIRAIPLVLREREDVAFIIGGDGSLRTYHEKLTRKLGVHESAIFTGKIPQNILPFYYAACDVFVIPSLQEAFGLVVAEAMASGKPVIGTRVGGIPDQITDGMNGFLVEPRSPEQIAERILRLINSPRKAKEMGRAGRITVEEKFNLNKRVDKIVELYNKLLEH